MWCTLEVITVTLLCKLYGTVQLVISVLIFINGTECCIHVHDDFIYIVASLSRTALMEFMQFRQRQLDTGM